MCYYLVSLAHCAQNLQWDVWDIWDIWDVWDVWDVWDKLSDMNSPADMS